MNSKISILAVMMTVLTIMTSCLSGNDTDTTYYNDAAITGFTLGTLKRIVHTKTKYTKVDSTYETTVACSKYLFSIDQEKGLIYNIDSLPVGTCTDKSLVTISTVNSGYVYLKSFTSDSVYTYSSSSDSLDFSKPRVLKVLSSDGSWVRDYTVDVRVHTEQNDSLYWEAARISLEIASLDDMHAVVFDNTIFAYGMVGNESKAYISSTKDGKTWTELTLPSASAVTMAANTKMLYALSDGNVYSMAAGTKTFTEESTNTGLKAIVAASRSEVYAISNDNKIVKSVDNGANWTEDATDDDFLNLPSRDFNGFCKVSKTNDEIDKVILIGNRAEVKDSCCVVWSKVVDNGNYDYTQQWMYQPFYANQWHNGLALNHLSVTPYNDGILMIGGKGLGTCKASAFSTMYFSRDDGLNWWKDSRFFLPPGFDSDLESFAMVTDADDYIWILCGNTGQVWRGHLSQLTWK